MKILYHNTIYNTIPLLQQGYCVTEITAMDYSPLSTFNAGSGKLRAGHMMKLIHRCVD
jgi:hypothetical protein